MKKIVGVVAREDQKGTRKRGQTGEVQTEGKEVEVENGTEIDEVEKSTKIAKLQRGWYVMKMQKWTFWGEGMQMSRKRGQTGEVQ